MHAQDSAPLDEYQLAHAEAFDQRNKPLKSVDFEYFADSRYGPWNPYWTVYQEVKSALRDQPTRLLVVGSGNGRDAILYAHLGFDVHGFDISPKSVAASQVAAQTAGLGDKAHFSVQPAEKLNFESNTFDVVVGVNVLHHIDRQRALPELSRVLKPGGRAIFKEPLVTPFRDKIRNWRIVTWILPRGVKSRKQGVYYDLIPGERNIDAADIALIRSLFVHYKCRRWHVLAKLSNLIDRRPLLERIDWMMFRLLPFMRRFGDQAVLTFEKPE